MPKNKIFFPDISKINFVSFSLCSVSVFVIFTYHFYAKHFNNTILCVRKKHFLIFVGDLFYHVNCICYDLSVT